MKKQAAKSPAIVQDVQPSAQTLSVPLAKKPVPQNIPASPSIEKHFPKPADDSPAGTTPQRRQWNFWAMYTMAGLVFVAGIGASIQTLLTNKQSEQQVLSISKQVSENTEIAAELPSEDKPANPNYVKEYKVAANLPRMIRIASIGIEARVLQVGVDKNNRMLTPANVYDAAWYTGSSRPGEVGAAVIDGHVSGPTQKGVFYRLKDLKPNDKIEIEMGNGSKLTYAVNEVKTVKSSDVDMGALLAPAAGISEGLNLITCGGKFDRTTNLFEDRVLVFSSRI